MAPVALLLSVLALAGAKPLSDPTGIAFDARGDLWICNYASGTVVEYAPGAISASGAPAPIATVPGLRGPNNVAFDRSGTLWVAEYRGGSVAAIRGGRVAVRVRFPRLAYAAPTGLAFDRAGNVWVTDQRSDRLWQFSSAQLRRSGEKRPARSVRVPGGAVAIN